MTLSTSTSAPTYIQPPPLAFYTSPPPPPPPNQIRRLLPLLNPPQSKFPNPLPSLPKESAQRVQGAATSSSTSNAKPLLDLPGFALSTHLIPAAYPRTLPYVPLPESSSSYLTLKDKAERKKAVVELTKEVIETRVRVSDGNGIDTEGRHYLGMGLAGAGTQSEEDSEKKASATATSRRYEDERLLWNCVNRYYRTGPPPNKKAKPLTLLLTHANGLHKETWEPFLRYLTSAASEEYYVSEAWSLEAVQHGDSAIVNADNLGLVYDWVDNARDIINFLTRYLPSQTSPNPDTLPIHLSQIPQREADTRIKYGFGDKRTIVSVGHSFGGCTAVLAALNYPALFHSLVPVDPVIIPPRTDRVKAILDYVVGALGRKSQWKDREEALASLRNSKAFFGRWDPEVLELYVRYGMISSADGKGVELKMPGIQEAIVFADGRSGIVSREVYVQLAELDPRVRLHWVMAGVGNPLAGDEEAVREVVWRRPTNSSNKVIKGSAHLIVQEAPRELAFEVHTFLKDTFGDKGKGNRLASEG